MHQAIQAQIMRRNNFSNQQQQAAQAQSRAQAMADMAHRANGFAAGPFDRNNMNPFAVEAIDLTTTADEHESMASSDRRMAAAQAANFEEHMFRKQQQQQQQQQHQQQQHQHAMMGASSGTASAAPASMDRIPAMMEQIRALQMMAAMRVQEMGSLRMALSEATAAVSEKDQEIGRLQQALALKDRALKTNEKRAFSEDPPEDPPAD